MCGETKSRMQENICSPRDSRVRATHPDFTEEWDSLIDEAAPIAEAAVPSGSTIDEDRDGAVKSLGAVATGALTSARRTFRYLMCILGASAFCMAR